MIRISPNTKWKNFEKIYRHSVRDRYKYFLFEFGRKANMLFYKHLGESIKSLPGSESYKKRLAVAEIRDKGSKAWFATVVEAQTLSSGEYDSSTAILSVTSKFQGIKGDPVSEILQAFGPWTVETIPFVPKSRAGLIVIREGTQEQVSAIKEANLSSGTLMRAKMLELGVSFDQRNVVYQTLRVVPDFESLVRGWEFGTVAQGHAHWRPSLRWLRREGIKKLEKDKKLLRVWIDAGFKYRVVRHLGVKLTKEELSRIQEWQNLTRQG